VIATQLNLRVDAGTAHRIKDTLRCGDIAYIAGQKGAFYQVLLGDLSGYAHSAYIFRIGAGGLRPRCSRGAAARSEQDQPLAGKAKRQKVASKPNRQETVIGAAPDGDPEPVPALGTPAPDNTTGAQGVATTDVDKSAPANSQLGSAPASLVTSVSAAAPRAAVKEQEPGPSKVLFAKDSTEVAPSEFPHHAHQAKFACAKCHHPVQRGSGGLSRVAGEDANESKRCRDCHKDGSGDVKVALEDAMHRTCRDCHTAMGANMAPRAPRRCADCHKAE